MPVLGPSRRSHETLRELRRLSRQADVVVAHGSSTLEACAVALAGTGVPFVYRTIGDPYYWVAPGYRRRLVGAMLRRARAHVVLWNDAARQLAASYGIPESRITVIPNAVPAEEFCAASNETRREARRVHGLAAGQSCLAFVGALSPEKDVAAIIRVVGAIDGVVALIAGDGPERQRLEEYATELAPGRVRFLGAVSDPREVYAAADLLLLPSLSEGMPAVVIEAGLVGTPAVASRVGALPEMITDASTGYLVDPGDHQELVAKTASALSNAAVMGENASDVFHTRYTMEQVVGPWAELLAKVANR